MQTREPKKRVNWVFVLVLIIVIPLAIFTIFMMNTIPPEALKPNSGIDTVSIDTARINRLQNDTTGN